MHLTPATPQAVNLEPVTHEDPDDFGGKSGAWWRAYDRAQGIGMSNADAWQYAKTYEHAEVGA
jgi:hypothetical protein